MVSVTKEQIEVLIELQNIDIESMKIKTFLDGIPPRVDQFDQEIGQVEQTIQEKESRISELKQEYRSQESDVKDNQERIRKNNEKLVAVKTNKEYHAILKENEGLHKKNSAIEDELLQKLDCLEKEESELQNDKAELEKLKNETAQEISALKEKGVMEEEKLKSLLTSWKEIEQTVAPEVIRRFKIAREQTKGNAIAAVKNAICQGCNMNIPPQMYNELQRCDKLEFCPRCYRIIYWEEGATSSD
jgi:predicted  nucleic acid-binding Zn-ribbon protein